MIAVIQNFDNRILSLIQRRLRCNFLDKLMPIITGLGTFGILWGATMLAFLGSNRYRRIGMLLFFTLLFSSVLTNLVLKLLVARPRPCHMQMEIPLLISRPLDFSFPSGHTTTSFAAATVILHANEVLGVIAFVLAALISFSRLYLFVHFPSDVAAGILFGLLSSYIILSIFFY